MRSEALPVLKSDLFLAAIMVGTGLVSDGLGAVRTVPTVAVIVGTLLAGSVYLAEHDVVPGLYPEVVTLVAFLVTVAVGTGLALVLSAPLAVTGAAALVGGGIGVASYRLVFGVVLPVPAYRLQQDDDPEERV